MLHLWHGTSLLETQSPSIRESTHCYHCNWVILEMLILETLSKGVEVLCLLIAWRSHHPHLSALMVLGTNSWDLAGWDLCPPELLHGNLLGLLALERENQSSWEFRNEQQRWLKGSRLLTHKDGERWKELNLYSLAKWCLQLGQSPSLGVWRVQTPRRERKGWGVSKSM